MSVRNPIRNAVVLGTAWALLASPWAMAQTDNDKIQLRSMPTGVKMLKSTKAAAPATAKPKAAILQKSALSRKAKARKIKAAPELKIQPQATSQAGRTAIQAQQARQFEMKVKQLAMQTAAKRVQFMQQQQAELEQENARTLARIRQMIQASDRNLKIRTQKGLR